MARLSLRGLQFGLPTLRPAAGGSAPTFSTNPSIVTPLISGTAAAITAGTKTGTEPITSVFDILDASNNVLHTNVGTSWTPGAGDVGKTVHVRETASNGIAPDAVASSSAAVVTVESLSDTFASDSGLWLDGNLAAAAVTISGGRGIWTPSEGAEINTGPNAASDPNGNEANATTGFSSTGVTASVETTDVNTGSYAIKVVAADGSADRLRIVVSNSTRGWLKLRCAAKRLIGTSWELAADSPHNPRLAITNSYVNYVVSGLKASDGFNMMLWCEAGAAGDAALIDNTSVKLVGVTDAVRLQRIYYPSSVQADIWHLAGIEEGVIFFKDVNNWVAAVIRTFTTGRRVSLIKCVGGTISQVSNGATITYVAGTTLKLTPSADMTTWTVTYGAATPVNAASITDFAASSNWYAGIVTNHNSGDTSQTGFDNFSTARIGGATPFS